MKNKIFNLLKEKQSLTFNEIKVFLNFNSSKILDNLLRELATENKIFYKKSKERYFIKTDETAIGIFKETKQDFAFVELEDNFSIFIPGKFTQNSLEGDTVKVLLFSLKEDEDPKRRAGKIVRILKRNGNNIIGRVSIKNGEPIFISDDSPKEHQYKLIKTTFNLQDDDILVTKFVDYISGIIYLKPIELLGNSSQASIDYLIVSKKNNLRIDFPNNVIKEAKSINHSVIAGNRKEFINSLIVTIDGETSKDLDDAIEIKKNEVGNFKLFVHIADVAYYVKENSEIDKEAFKRGTSVYLMDKVFPMLPQILSNNLASLNPGTRKYTMTVEIEMNKMGKILKYDVYNSVITSKYQLTYSEVDSLLSGRVSILRNDIELTKMLLDANEFASIIRKQKIEEGMIDFALPETKIKLNTEGEPIEITFKEQTSSEKLIEDLMVVTNESVANLLSDNKLLGMFRVHSEPALMNLEKFSKLAKVFGEHLPKNLTDIQSKDLANFITSFKDKPYADILKKFLIQSMEKAIYSPIDKGHYALGLKNYLHFTSPIRRFPDLIVHRILKNFYLSTSKENISSKIEYLDYAAKWLSDKEREAMISERKLMDIKKSRFMKSHIGEIIEGIIVSTTNFGFFVDLEYQTQGLVRIDNMKDDEYYHDDSKFSIIGKKNKKTFKLGDKVKVKISDVDTIRGLVDLTIV